MKNESQALNLADLEGSSILLRLPVYLSENKIRAKAGKLPFFCIFGDIEF